MTGDDFEVPHAGWWTAIGLGLGTLAIVAFHDDTYAAWTRYVTAAVPQGLLQAVFVLSVAAHLGEALYARALARRLGLEAAAGRWFWQTLALGFPSLRLLRRRVESGVAPRPAVGSRP